MEKYFAFLKMLEFMADYADVVDADMNYYKDTMKITGENDGQVIEIQVSISKKKEENEDGN